MSKDFDGVLSGLNLFSTPEGTVVSSGFYIVIQKDYWRINELTLQMNYTHLLVVN